jgi:hypothetical protein
VRATTICLTCAPAFYRRTVKCANRRLSAPFSSCLCLCLSLCLPRSVLRRAARAPLHFNQIICPLRASVQATRTPRDCRPHLHDCLVPLRLLLLALRLGGGAARGESKGFNLDLAPWISLFHLTSLHSLFS